MFAKLATDKVGIAHDVLAFFLLLRCRTCLRGVGSRAHVVVLHQPLLSNRIELDRTGQASWQELIKTRQWIQPASIHIHIYITVLELHTMATTNRDIPLERQQSEA